MSQTPGENRPDAGRSSVEHHGLEPLEPRLLLSASLYDAQAPLLPVAAEQAEVVAQAAGDQTFGIDVSHHQGSINWTNVANDGIDFVWAKATEGVDFIDTRWFSNVSGAHNAGLYVGGYHYARPDTNGGDTADAQSEAGDFYDAVKNYLGDGYLRPALDLEEGDGLSTTALTNWVHDFMDEFTLLSGGIVPIIYMNGYYASQVNSSVTVYDLWYANPTNNPNNPPSAPSPYSSYDLWQYSWTENIGGISPVDANVFLENLSAFEAKYVISTIPDDHGDGTGDATPITVPSTTAGVIGTGADSDWFELNLDAGTSYTFSVLDDGLGSAELTLNTNLGNPLVTDTGPAVGSTLAEITYTPIATQVYYLSVDSGGTGGYDLVVQETDDHGDSIAEASELIGGLGLGGLQTGSDDDFFHFTATAGMDYAIELQSAGLTQGVINLYNSAGSLVGQQFGTGSPLAQMDWSAAANDEMYVKVWSNTGAVGDYAISVSESAPALPGDLDGDGFVGLSDLDLVLNNWNLNVPPGDAAADPTGDGFVGLDDLDIVLNHWNTGTPPVAESTSATAEESTAAATGTQILGIDVSQFQNTINWNTVAASSGREFAFIRAVDRYGNVDTRFLDNIVDAHAVGIHAGAYHFVTPWTDGYNDAVEEAQLFATTLAPYITDGYLRPVIDIEGYSGTHSPDPINLSNTVLTNWVHDYMDEFVRLTGVEPLIYTNTNYAVNAYNSSVNQYDLWLANWTNNPNNPPAGNADGVWNGYDFWQYSGGGETVPGIAGGVDGNVFFGSVTDLVNNYGIVIAPDDHGNVTGDATPLAVPSNTFGELDTIMDEDWFAVTLSSGTQYDFSVIGGTLGEVELSLHTPAGTPLVTNSGPASGGTLAALSYTPTIGDTYFVRVQSTLDLGTYVLTAQEADDYGDTIGEATGLAIGGFAFAGLQTSADVDMFQFSATDGKQYDIDVQSSGLADATLTLYDQVGTVLDQVIGAGGASPLASMNWVATANADVYVAVSSDSGSVGEYLITLSESDPSLPGDLDGDGFVGLSDLDLVLNNWNLNVPPGDALADPSGDGFVGLDDLDIVLNHWNTGTPPVAGLASAAEPEATAAVGEPEAGGPVLSSSMAERSYASALTGLRDETRSAFIVASSEDEPVLGMWETSEPG